MKSSVFWNLFISIQNCQCYCISFSFSSQAACLHYISWHAPLGLLETGILSFKERATLSVGYGLVWYNWGMVWYGRTRELYGMVEEGKRHFVCCRLSAKYLIATLTTVSTSSPQCIMHDTAGGLQMQKQPSSKWENIIFAPNRCKFHPWDESLRLAAMFNCMRGLHPFVFFLPPLNMSREYNYSWLKVFLHLCVHSQQYNCINNSRRRRRRSV